MGVDVSKSGHSKSVHLLPISCQDCEEISQIETNQQVIFNGMVDGATRVLEVLGPIVGINSEEDRHQTLLEIFPDLAIQKAAASRERGRLERLKCGLRKITQRTRGWLGLGSVA
jgi:hypothetical protein